MCEFVPFARRGLSAARKARVTHCAVMSDRRERGLLLREFACRVPLLGLYGSRTSVVTLYAGIEYWNALVSEMLISDCRCGTELALVSW